VSSSLFHWPDGFVATVGVFDGLHRGHRAILDPLVAAAGKLGLLRSSSRFSLARLPSLRLGHPTTS